MMAASTPVVEISCKDEIWTVKTSTLIRTTVLNFKVGEEYDEVMPSGEVLKVGSFILICSPNALSSWPLGPQHLWTRPLNFSFWQGCWNISLHHHLTLMRLFSLFPVIYHFSSDAV